MSINCGSDGSCPYIFYCDAGKCYHDPLFPLAVYSTFCYLLLVCGVMLSNVGGLSAGIFKVPILMDMLNYPVNVATDLSYPIVTGASFANFLQLIPKRHPTRKTSLVDYNIVLLLIPCVSFGSTLGSILVKFIPLLYQDIILFVVFILLTAFFFIKAKNFTPEESVAKLEHEMELPDLSERGGPQNGDSSGLRNSLVIRDSVKDSVRNSLQNSLIRKSNIDDTSELPQKVEEDFENSVLLQKQLDYESTYHWRDILISIVVFTVFEVLSLLSQGKIIDFSFCSWIFGLTFGLLVIVLAVYLAFVYKFTSRKMEYYARIGYDYDTKLAEFKNFGLITGGGFIGGFLQGIIGVGSGNCMVAAMLTVGIDPKVTSATSGYQIVFIGLSSLIEALAFNELTWIEVGFFFTICFVIGGGLTLLLYHLLRDKPKAPGILLIIITCLCVMSTIGIIPNVYLTQLFYGWPYMLTVKSFC